MFNFNEYYKISKKIEEDPKLVENEAYRRTAISRAYYSAYKAVDDYFKMSTNNLYKGAKGYRSHYNVWQLLGRGANKDLKNLDQVGLRVLEKRKKSDYESNSTVSKTDLKVVNLEVEKIISKIHNENTIKKSV